MKRNHVDQQLNIKQYFSRVLFWKCHAVFFVFLFIGYGVYYTHTYKALEQKLIKTREAMVVVSEKAIQLQQEQQARIINKKGQKAISAIGPKVASMREGLLPVLELFSASTMDGVWLHYFSFQRHINGKDSVNVQGSALKRMAVREYVLGLKKSQVLPVNLYRSLAFNTNFTTAEKAAMAHLDGDKQEKKSFFSNFSMSYQGSKSKALKGAGKKQNAATLIQQLLNRGKK